MTSPARAERNTKIAQMRQQGALLKVIGARFHLTNAAVCYVLRGLNIKPPADIWRCGHPRTPENMVWNTRWRCRICKQRITREYWRRRARRA